MKKLVLLISTMTLFVSNSFADNQQLSTSIQKDKAYIIDAKSLSCRNKKIGITDTDINSRYATFSGVQIRWTSTTSHLFISKITVAVTSPNIVGGKFSVDLNSEELASLLGNHDCPWDNMGRSTCPTAMDDYYQGPGYVKRAYNAYTPTVLNLDCYIRAGGIQLTLDQPFNATGEIRFSGFEINENTNASTPVSSSSPITLINI